VRLTRRRLLHGAGLALAASVAPAGAAAGRDVEQEVALLERDTGGRIGLAALVVRSGAYIGHRADERFAMCSTFKLMLAAAVLTRIDSGELRAAQRLSYARSDLLAHSPFTGAHVAEGGAALEALLQAVVELSDNTAANLLLECIGGPPGYTAYLRALGDRRTRLDRVELALNSNLPGDPRDTTTPAAMLADMRRTLLGGALSAASRTRLLGWMRNCRTGEARLRARLPAGWVAGDKTGTGARGAANDLAIFRPPHRAPILVACYMSGSERTESELESVQARIGALVAEALG
jgi:beta-lactamase class A